MELVFYISGALATVCVTLALSAKKAVHGLLYLLVGLMSLALNLYALGNELGALLLMIVYAGAIMVLFIFVVMLLNPSPTKKNQLATISFIREFLGPLLIALLVFAQFVFVLVSQSAGEFVYNVLSPKDFASALFKDGWFFVELLSLLLTAALIGAFHVGRRRKS